MELILSKRISRDKAIIGTEIQSMTREGRSWELRNPTKFPNTKVKQGAKPANKNLGLKTEQLILTGHSFFSKRVLLITL